MTTTHLQQVLEDLKQGKPVVVVDDYDRENEGDLVLSAEKITREHLVFAMNKAGGLMCLPCEGNVLDRLGIPQMVSNSNDPLETPFSVSIDHIETSTGMSADDRLKTISLLTDETSRPEQVQMPGHLFPLRARAGLLYDRRGHTEASISLMKMAGLKPASIIVEIMNDDGTMTKGDQLKAFCKKHQLLLISIEEICEAIHKIGLV